MNEFKNKLVEDNTLVLYRNGLQIVPKMEWKFGEEDPQHYEKHGWWVVTAVAWFDAKLVKPEWKYNVYVTVAGRHPLYNLQRGHLPVPMHGGASYDQLVGHGFQEPRYSFDRDTRTRKIGCDFSHDMDWYAEHNPMISGLPTSVYLCAAELVEYMEDWRNGNVQGKDGKGGDNESE